MLLEDERGTVNLIVPGSVYERYRAIVRASPLVRAKGRLERREGTTNVLVSEVAELEWRETLDGAAAERPANPAAGDAIPLPRSADVDTATLARCPRRRRPSAPLSERTLARRRLRERAVAELRAVAPAGHSWGRRGR
ncbi:MAG TPA: hypothetical protein VFU04_08565 [Solirubrobacterales bacterium]|nr:hypothetical protein [Solirubrobacterales bacterium]